MSDINGSAPQAERNMMTLGDLAALIVAGYAAPAQSARRMIATGLGMPIGALMVVLGYLITAILLKLMGHGGESEGFLSLHIMNLLLQLGYFFFISMLVFWFGRMSGGTGTREQTHLVIGWHALVTSFMAPLTAGFMEQMNAAQTAETAVAPAIGGGTMMLAIAGVGLNFWLLANYIAALHGFRNVWGVLGVLVGIPIALGMLAIMAMSGAAIQ